MAEGLKTRREALIGALGLGAGLVAGCSNNQQEGGATDDDSGPFDGLPLNARPASTIAQLSAMKLTRSAGAIRVTDLARPACVAASYCTR